MPVTDGMRRSGIGVKEGGSEMLEKIFRCVECEGNAYPCVLSVKTEAKSASSTVSTPIKCPFGGEKTKWEGVKE